MGGVRMAGTRWGNVTSWVELGVRRMSGLGVGGVRFRGGYPVGKIQSITRPNDGIDAGRR